jgi:Mn2+/Fe2+ NRAMP family transporter
VDENKTRADLKNKLVRVASAIGPGIFIIGYIIGTGSVTSMAKAGAEYGLTLNWALALSCFCTYILIVAIGRCTIVTGQTLIFTIRRRFGSMMAIFIILGLMATVVTSVMGVMGIAVDVVREWSKLVVGGKGFNPLLTALVFNAILFYLFWKGSHGAFLRAMAVIVALMGLCFVATSFLVIPRPLELLEQLKPAIPAEGQVHLVLAAMVGTTMASVCIVTRSYLVAEKGWTLKDLKVENRDAMLSLTLTFIVSSAIMACAAGTMLPAGIPVENAIDMVKTLEPMAGRFATALFVTGIVAAALSSLFPNYTLGPWLVCDFLNRSRTMSARPVRLGVAAVASLAFVVPIFGGRPVLIMIVSQALSPVVMPLLIVLLLIMLNSRRTVGDYKTPRILNVGLFITLAFALLVSYSAVLGLLSSVRSL